MAELRHGVDEGGTLWLDRAQGVRVATRMSQILEDGAPSRSELDLGEGVLVLQIDGPEQAPILNLIHERDGAVAVPWGQVSEVVAALREIVSR